MDQWKLTGAAKKELAGLARIEASKSWPFLAARGAEFGYESVCRPPWYKIDEIFKRQSGYFEAKQEAISNAGLFQKSRVSNEWFIKEDSAKLSYQKFYWDQFEKSVAELITLNASKEPADWGKLVDNRWSPTKPLPLPGFAEFDPRTAEFFCTQYMQFMGADSATTTRGSKDNGIDIDSEFYVAQVKHLHSKVGVKAIREFLGASISTGKVAVFFSKTGYSQEAVDFAVRNKILLYSYTGIFSPCTVLSRIIQIEGMHVRWQDQAWMHSDSGWSQAKKEKYGQDRWDDNYFGLMAALSRR